MFDRTNSQWSMHMQLKEKVLRVICFVPAYLLGKAMDAAFRKAKFKKIRSSGWRGSNGAI
jgi:hypothetical protein